MLFVALFMFYSLGDGLWHRTRSFPLLCIVLFLTFQGAYGFDIEPVEADEVVSLIRQQIGVRVS